MAGNVTPRRKAETTSATRKKSNPERDDTRDKVPSKGGTTGGNRDKEEQGGARRTNKKIYAHRRAQLGAPNQKRTKGVTTSWTREYQEDQPNGQQRLVKKIVDHGSNEQRDEFTIKEGIRYWE